MANYNQTPNMLLPNPVPSVDPGPDYANNIQTSLNILDQHNHTPNSGVPVPTAGLNINADLPFNGNNATLLRTVRFNNLAAAPSLSTDLGCIAVSGGNLYYVNTAGTAVQITNGSSVNAGAGSITGLPSGTASVTFSSATYVFQSATSTPATLDAGSVIFRNTTPSSFGVTVSPVNSLGSNYSLVLPTIPASQSFLALDTSGNITAYAPVAGGLTTSNLSASAGIVGTQLASGTITNSEISTSTLNFGSYTPTLSSLTNCSPTASSWVYSRIGNVCTVSGQFSLATSGGSSSQFSFNATIPFSSTNFSGTSFAGGSGNGIAPGGPAILNVAVLIISATSTQLVTFFGTDGSTFSPAPFYNFIFQYKIQ